MANLSLRSGFCVPWVCGVDTKGWANRALAPGYGVSSFKVIHLPRCTSFVGFTILLTIQKSECKIATTTLQFNPSWTSARSGREKAPSCAMMCKKSSQTLYGLSCWLLSLRCVVTDLVGESRGSLGVWSKPRTKQQYPGSPRQRSEWCS